MQASTGRSRDGTLHVTFRLEGTVSRIRLPEVGPLREGARLWEHTCFELFIAREGGPAYHELNVAPSREWALYAFRAYRDRAATPGHRRGATPDVSVHHGDSHVEIETRLSLPDVSPAYAAACLRVGLSAVVETTEGALSYWAIRHPRDKPDFHHPDAFALRLEPPAARS